MNRDMEEIEQSTTDLLSDLRRERLSVVTGEKRGLETNSVFNSYKHVLDVFLVAELDHARKEMWGEERRVANKLHNYLLNEYPTAQVSYATDRAFNHLFQSTIGHKTRKIPLFFARPEIACLEKEKEREEMFNKWAGTIASLNPLLVDRLRGYRIGGEELGYSDFLDLVFSSMDSSLKWVRELIDLIQDRTKTGYADSMDELATRKLGKPLDELREHDVLRLFRAPDFDTTFREDSLVQSITSLLEKMGADASHMSGVTLCSDDEWCLPRAFSIPVTIPGQIFTGIRPMGGYEDYLSLFDAAGRTLSLNQISRDIPPAFRYLGDWSITSSYGLLFQNIIGSREWLREFGLDDGLEAFHRLFHVRKLFQLRKLAAQVEYELELFDDGTALETEHGPLYESIMEEHLGFYHRAGPHLSKAMFPLSSVYRLRAHVFGSILNATLEDKYGERWYWDPGAHSFLSEIWAWGGRFSLDELTNYLGYAELNSEPMIEDIEQKIRLI